MNVLDAAMKEFGNKTKYIYGHAEQGYEVTGGKNDLQAFHDYLGNLLKFVGDEIKSGKTQEEILKASQVPGSPEWKGDGIQRPLQAAFEELSAG